MRPPSSEGINIAPDEGKHQTSMLSDKFCEGLTFPYRFLNGKFDHIIDRDVKLSYVHYFNQRLLNYTQRVVIAYFVMKKRLVSLLKKVLIFINETRLIDILIGQI